MVSFAHVMRYAFIYLILLCSLLLIGCTEESGVNNQRIDNEPGVGLGDEVVDREFSIDFIDDNYDAIVDIRDMLEGWNIPGVDYYSLAKSRYEYIVSIKPPQEFAKYWERITAVSASLYNASLYKKEGNLRYSKMEYNYAYSHYKVSWDQLWKICFERGYKVNDLYPRLEPYDDPQVEGYPIYPWEYQEYMK